MTPSQPRPIEILLVEDNAGDVELARNALESSRIVNRMHIVRDGEQALAYLRRESGYEESVRPDLVLLDWNLPRLSGQEVLRALKADVGLRRIPVVVLTTSSSERDVVRAYDGHANCFITKPIDIGQFFEVVNAIEKLLVVGGGPARVAGSGRRGVGLVNLRTMKMGGTGAALRVLLVEDNPGDVELIRAYLGDSQTVAFDLEVTATLSGARAALGTGRVDGVLLDLGLPDAERFEALEQLRVGWKEMPIVVLTGQDDSVVGVDAIRRGACDYLSKNEISSELLVRTLVYAIERRRTRQTLAAKETLYRELFENTLDGLAVHEVRNAGDELAFDARFLAVNDAFLRQVGKTREEIVGRSLWSVSMDLATVCRPVFRDVALNGGSGKTALYLGTLERTFEVSAFRNAPDQVTATFHDVTEKLRSEREITEQRQLLERVEGSALMGSWRRNLKTNRVIWSRGMFRIFELPIEGGAPPLEEQSGLFEEGEFEKLSAVVNGAIKHGRPYRIDVSRRTTRGEIRWLELHGIPSRDQTGEVTEIVGFVRDVSAEREAESQVRLLAAVARTTDNLVVITDASRRIVWVNAAFQRVSGYQLEDVRGCYPPEFLSGPETDRAAVESMEQRLARGERVSQEVANYSRDKRLYWVDLSVEALRDESGRIRNFVSVGVDVTERRKVENDLREARNRADAASRAKSQFVANMSHEIRTPLNAILGMSELVRSDPTSDEAREYLETISASGDALLELISAILHFSQIESGRIELRESNVVLAEVIDECLRLEKRPADGRNLQLSSSIDPGIPVAIRADHGRLRQILINLIGNAIKFTTVGEVTLSVGPGRGLIDGPALRFAVVDTGGGIAECDQEIIFESFRQVDVSDSRKFGGAGLGLAICRRLVELMGGRIGVRSEIGEGSEFFFEIPLVPATLQESRRSVERVGLDEGLAEKCPLQILVVEDCMINQRLIVAVLRKMGYRPDLVGDGEQALTAARARHYDVILMDLQMPVMSGLDATREILADSRTNADAHCPQIIALTANAQEEERERCLAAGMVEFLTKPLRNTDLALALGAAYRRAVQAVA